MFKKVFSFNGRINRIEYAITFVFYIIVYVFIRIAIRGGENARPLALLYIPLFWMAWAQGAKRCHDINKSGWWQIIPFYVLWMIFQKGDLYANQYDGGGSHQAFYGADDYERPFVIDVDTHSGPAPKEDRNTNF
jgi:uncharacterized membrane protein YhaH (DUF805 family)